MDRTCGADPGAKGAARRPADPWGLSLPSPWSDSRRRARRFFLGAGAFGASDRAPRFDARANAPPRAAKGRIVGLRARCPQRPMLK